MCTLALLLALMRTVHAQHHDSADATPGYAETPPVLYPGEVRSFRDVIFAEPSGFRPLTLDLYLPPEGGPKKTGRSIHTRGRLAQPDRS